MKLTDKIVDHLPVPAKGNKRIPDSELRGLNGQVTASGERGFVFRYRFAGRDRLYTIGSRSSWTTVAARNRARELRRLVDQGIDPHEHEAQARDAAITLREFWSRVYEPLHVSAKRPQWARDLRSMMRNDILPRLGNRPVKDIDYADVADLHRAITRRAPVRANRARDVLSHVMSFAERPHIIDGGERIPALRPTFSNPARGVPRNIEAPRERFLSPAEIARLVAALDAHSERTSASLVKFLLLTGCRFGEAASATWDQFDLGRGTWCKPASKTKQRRDHVIPLSAPALLLLQQLREQNGSGQYLFPGRVGHLTKVKKFWRTVTRQASLEGVRIHDLRHSFASVLASGGASLLLIGQLLGHSQAQTTRRYSHLLDTVQREAVERAGALISGKAPADVVPLRERGAHRP
jgi:integrase